jgi:DNA processing protein
MTTTKAITFGLEVDDECVIAAAICAIPKMTPKRLKQLLASQRPSSAWNEVHNEAPHADFIERIAKKMNDARMCATYIGNPTYPEVLCDDETAPAVLFWQGDLATLNQRRIGIVGTRAATAAGRYMASHLAFDLAEHGVATVSGLARGIDAWAHKGVKLACERGVARPQRRNDQRPSIGLPIGVVASGLDVVYPRENADLWQFVGERGLLLSESPPGTPPEAFRFPMRNRILAALSEVLVVIESRTVGGSMITVEEAQKRDITVMAVPGSPRNASSAGTNLLLQQGCAPVVDVQDVLVALGLDHRGRHPRIFEARRKPNAHDGDMLNSFHGQALTLDQILMRTKGDLVATALSLGRLESDGWVVNNSGWWEVLGLQPAAGYGESSE